MSTLSWLKWNSGAFDGREDDIVLLVMGPSGSGKSTFINEAIGKKKMPVRHDLESAPSTVASATFDCSELILQANAAGLDTSLIARHQGRRLVLVDTPGFDDTHIKELEILVPISAWIAKSYINGTKVSGILFLHEISQSRMLGSTSHILNLFEKLCGTDATPNVILVTTKWNPKSELVGKEREKQLLDIYWKPMIDKGAKPTQFRGDRNSALAILIMVASTAGIAELHVQRELIEQNKNVRQTAAARLARHAIKDHQKQQKKRERRKEWMESKSILKPEDISFADGRVDDVIVIIMGATGSGKSTLINKMLDNKLINGETETQPMQVGHGPQSCTSGVQAAVLNVPDDFYPSFKGRRIVLVDTPGFDDTYIGDQEILRRISAWLAVAYNNGTAISGIVYVHDMTCPRVTGSAVKHLQMFRNLCGDPAIRNVVILTSKWDKIGPKHGQEFEDGIIKHHWQPIIDRGATIQHFRSDEDESARDALKAILFKADRGDTILQVQTEVVELKKLLPQTQAGRTLRHALEELLAEHKAESEMTGIDSESRRQLDKKKADITGQITQLSLPLGRALRSYFQLSA